MKTDFNDDWDTNESGLHNEINVTPFIDVVLVLLIVFMVAAPLATSVIPVQLPSITQAPAVVAQPDDPLYVTLQKDNSLYVGNNLVSQAGFTEALLKETNRNLDTKILIKADSEIDYGAVVGLLNQVRVAGYTKVGLMGLQTSSNVLTAKEEAGSVAESTIGGVVGTADSAMEHTAESASASVVDDAPAYTTQNADAQ
ncbi:MULTISPECIES: biopolymer transporter ExbD [unclassified Bartonella]|uniref:biopolymer transporter ExbD n=1 Tax=unclassified Bartonella TaxID=2645622 RepID=UPI00300DD032